MTKLSRIAVGLAFLLGVEHAHAVSSFARQQASPATYATATRPNSQLSAVTSSSGGTYSAT